MAEVIETAYVRIRPQVEGFRAEASRQIAQNLSAVRTSAAQVGASADDVGRFGRESQTASTRVVGLGRSAIFAGAAFAGAAGLGVVVRTATDEFEENARVGAATRAVIRATGGAANVTAKQIDRLAASTLRKTGIDDEQVAAAANVLLTFRQVRNEVGEGNDVFTRALALSADLSTVLRTDLAGSALQLGKALADPILGVTALRRAGVNFSADQRRFIRSLVESGQVLRAQRVILSEVERQVGGTAEAVGRTLPGQLDVLRERAKNALGDYVKRISESRDASELAAQGTTALSSAWGVLEGIVRTLGPTLVATARAGGSLVNAIGVPTILAGVVAYKAFAVAATLAARAQKVVAIASAAAIPVMRTLTIAQRAAFAGSILSGAALQLVGGPLGAVTLGVAALAAGIFLLHRRSQDAAGGLNATRRALDLLNASIAHSRGVGGRVDVGTDALAQARELRQQALQSLRGAEGRLAASPAGRGSLERRALEDQIASAREKLAAATREVSAAEVALGRARGEARIVEQQRQNVIDETTRRLLEQVTAIREQERAQAQGPAGRLGARLPAADRDRIAAERSLERAVRLFGRLRTAGEGVQRVVGAALESIARSVDRLPSEKEIRIVVTQARRGASLAEIEARVAIANARTVADRLSAERALDLIRNRGLSTEERESRVLQEQYAAVVARLKAERENLRVKKEAAAKAIDEARAAREGVDAQREQVSAARESLRVARETVATARQGVEEAQEALRSTIAANARAVDAAVSSAKQNLRGIGDSIAEAIGRFAERAGERIGPRGPLATRFRQLREEVLRGRGGPETQRAAQEITARIAATRQTAGGDDTAERARRRIADLSDNFNRGRIKLDAFNRGLDRVLSDFGVTTGAFRRLFGTAAANELVDLIRGARSQAAATAAGPRRPGGGTAPDIVAPLEAVAQARRDQAQASRRVEEAVSGVADAERDVERATKTLAKEQRELQRAQLKEQRLAKVELKAIRLAVEAQLRVKRTEAKKDKAKPKGTAADQTDANTRDGATVP